MSQANSAPGTLVRISVTSEDRRLDIGVPAQLPFIELLPGFARALGVLDPTLVHGGYALQRADGSAVDPTRAAAVQGIGDGELLTLVRGGLIAEPRVYDDIVEAVIDASSEQHRPWTPRDNARTALAVSLSFLALCAVLLLAAGSATPFAPLVAGGAVIVLAATSAVVARVGQPEAGHALGLAAALFGGITGYLLVPAAEPWGWPFAAAGLGLVVTGGIALAATGERPEIHLIPIVLGLLLGVTATIAALTGTDVPAYALMIAVVAALANGLPWLALSSTRLRVISPQSDLDIFGIPEPVDGADAKRRAGSGQRVLVSFRIAFGLAVLTGTVLVAQDSLAGGILCALAFAGMMFQSRQTYSRSGVLTVLGLGAVGIAVTGLAVAASQPELRVPLLVVLIVATALIVGLTMLSPRARIRLARVADTVEVLVLALVLPFGVAAAGIA